MRATVAEFHEVFGDRIKLTRYVEGPQLRELIVDNLAEHGLVIK